MHALLLTAKGLEATAALEAKELVSARTKVVEGGVIVSIKNHQDLCDLCYMAQSITKTILILEKIKPTEDFSLREIDTWPGSFRVSATCLDKSVEKVELEQEVGAAIKKKTNEKVDLENSDTVFYVFLNKQHKILGVDFSGIDLSKRDYKIFNTRQSIRGTLAYFLLRFTDYKKGDAVVDPFCDTGEIVIEAAYYASQLPLHYFQKNELAFTHFDTISYSFSDFTVPITHSTIFGFSHLLNDLKSAQKNAKIAGVQKLISFSKVEADWLDIKFKDKQVDKIITKLFFSQHTKKEKLVEELFRQAQHVLKKKGKIGILTNDPEKINSIAVKHGFTREKQQSVWAGKKELAAVTYRP